MNSASAIEDLDLAKPCLQLTEVIWLNDMVHRRSHRHNKYY